MLLICDLDILDWKSLEKRAVKMPRSIRLHRIHDANKPNRHQAYAKLPIAVSKTMPHERILRNGLAGIYGSIPLKLLGSKPRVASKTTRWQINAP